MTPSTLTGLAIFSIAWVTSSPPGRRGEGVDDVVDHPRAQAVVLEHHSDDCDQDDGERRQREQHAVGDAAATGWIHRRGTCRRPGDRSHRRSRDVERSQDTVASWSACQSAGHELQSKEGHRDAGARSRGDRLQSARSLSPVAQLQSIRLLTEGSLVRVQPASEKGPIHGPFVTNGLTRRLARAPLRTTASGGTRGSSCSGCCPRGRGDVHVVGRSHSARAAGNRERVFRWTIGIDLAEHLDENRSASKVHLRDQQHSRASGEVGSESGDEGEQHLARPARAPFLVRAHL